VDRLGRSASPIIGWKTSYSRSQVAVYVGITRIDNSRFIFCNNIIIFKNVDIYLQMHYFSYDKFNYEELVSEKSFWRILLLVQLVLHYFHKLNFNYNLQPAGQSSVQRFEPQNIIN
jgi:hypothetical protein